MLNMSSNIPFIQENLYFLFINESLTKNDSLKDLIVKSLSF
jgi:hypothetical protein